MQDTVSALQKLLPEAIQMFKSRYILLQVILQNGPIGRRGLVSLLDISERMIRNEVDKLAQIGLVEITTQGIIITKAGEEVLSILYLPLHALEECTRLENEVATVLGLKKAILVRGDLDKNKSVQNELGLACSSLLDHLLKDHMSVAITGGTTISKMVECMPKQVSSYKNLMVIPARGSIGQRVEFQATTIAVELAKKLDAQYELLTIPDNLSNQSINLIKNEPHIQKLLQKIAETDIIIFGIGDAVKMAKRRNESQDILDLLQEKKAIAESFRHYFDASGQVVYATESIGLTPQEAQKIPIRIAVASGASKANAIIATRDLLKDSYLILDEGAAREILNILS